MPRKFKLQMEDRLTEAALVKFTTQDLYGKRGKKYIGENEEKYKKGYITPDGRSIIETGCFKQSFISDEGNPISLRDLVKYDGDEKVPFVESTYKIINDFSNFKEISMEEFSLFNINTTYILMVDNSEILIKLKQKVNELYENNILLKYPYAYYETQKPDEMVLFPKNDEIVVLVGNMTEPILGKKEELMIDYDEEEDEDLGIGFGVW